MDGNYLIHTLMLMRGGTEDKDQLPILHFN